MRRPELPTKHPSRYRPATVDDITNPSVRGFVSASGGYWAKRSEPYDTEHGPTVTLSFGQYLPSWAPAHKDCLRGLYIRINKETP